MPRRPADPIRVRSLAEALGTRGQFGRAAGYLLAPLTRLNGGARAWKALRYEGGATDDKGVVSGGRPVEWVSEDYADAHPDADVRPPSTEPLEALPPLPSSPLRVWELAWADDQGDQLEPVVIIDQRPQDRPAAAAPPERTERRPSTPRSTEEVNSDSTYRAYKLMRVMVKDRVKDYKEQARAAEERAARDRADKAAADARVHDAVKAHVADQHRLAQAQAANPITTMLGTIYSSSPKGAEDFTHGIMELGRGLLDELREKKRSG